MSGVSLSADLEALFLGALDAHVEAGARLCVGFSGGMDSTVLLHLACRLSERRVRAIYVDHNLHPDSAEWGRHCTRFCAAQGIECLAAAVEVHAGNGGLEAAARSARYQLFAEQLAADEILLTAHHAGDQLETFLLQALRGAGPRGLAAMPVFSRARGFAHLRPLLAARPEFLEAYAGEHGLAWIEDPSNAQTDFDRNYLRLEVLPALYKRWPSADAALGRSARLSAEAGELLDALAQLDAGSAVEPLPIGRIRGLSPARQANLLRYCIRANALPVPTETQLNEALQCLLGARADGQPVAAWAGGSVRRFKDQLWFFRAAEDPGNPALCQPEEYSWDGSGCLAMAYPRGKLEAERSTRGGIAPHWFDKPVTVRFRQGGEQLRPGRRAPTRDLKKLLQESDIVPWMRSHIPLVYSGDTLLAAGDMWIDAAAASPPDEDGYRLRWSGHGVLK